MGAVSILYVNILNLVQIHLQENEAHCRGGKPCARLETPAYKMDTAIILDTALQTDQRRILRTKII